MPEVALCVCTHCHRAIDTDQEKYVVLNEDQRRSRRDDEWRPIFAHLACLQDEPPLTH